MNGIENALKKDGLFIGKTKGDSMKPMLENGDTVIIVPPTFPLKKADVPVYRKDGHYTMHRIVCISRKGYIIRGDNRLFSERDITDRDIVGVLFAFYHNGKCISCNDAEYIKYSKKVSRGYPIRLLKYFFKRMSEKIKNT